MKDVLEFIVKAIVDEPDAVQVSAEESDQAVTLRVAVAADDKGKVIGRHGRTVRAVRDVVRAAGTRAGVATRVEILE
jgi:predicted RNA-binding protein YlqC (UPF0109 family)